MGNVRPERRVVERAAEFAVVAFLAVARAHRAEVHLGFATGAADLHMLTARAVAALAADIDERATDAGFAAVAGGRAEAHRVTGDTVGIRIGPKTDQCGESAGVAALQPGLRGARM